MKKLFLLGLVLFLVNTFVIAQTGYSGNTVNYLTSEKSSALGQNNVSTGLNTFIGGSNSQATGSHSFGFGRFVKASADYSFVLGRGLEDISGPVLFENNIWSSLKIGFGTPSNQPSLMITGVGQESKFSPEYYGFVGIFTEAPTSELDVNGTITTNKIKVTDGAIDGYVLTYDDVSGEAFWAQPLGGSSGSSPWLTSGSSVYYNTGNVGIGLSNPTYKLDVNGSTRIKQELIFNSSYDAQITYGSTTSTKKFKIVSLSNASPPGKSVFKGICVDAYGNLGVGIDNPTSDLDVFGNTKTTHFQMTSNPGTGKILQSDASGNASWVDPENMTGVGAWDEDLNTNSVLYSGNAKIGGDFTIDSQTSTLFYGKAGLPSTFSLIKKDGPDIGKGVDDVVVLSVDDNGIVKVSDFQLNSDGTTAGYILTDTDGNGNASWVDPQSLNGVGVWDETGNVAYYMDAVGIGTSDVGTYKLAVAGSINATLIRVTESVPGSDYVFENDYNLMSLNELETYVKANKHLPEVMSAEEFAKDGYSLGEMDDVLLRKVEELTLYVIDQDKTIQEQSEILKQQQEVLAKQQLLIDQLLQQNK